MWKRFEHIRLSWCNILIHFASFCFNSLYAPGRRCTRDSRPTLRFIMPRPGHCRILQWSAHLTKCDPLWQHFRWQRVTQHVWYFQSEKASGNSLSRLRLVVGDLSAKTHRRSSWKVRSCPCGKPLGRAPKPFGNVCFRCQHQKEAMRVWIFWVWGRVGGGGEEGH